MVRTPPTTWFATRLQLEWSAELQAQADSAGIRLFRAWPAARTYWKTEWGEGDVFTGFPDDPAEVVLELRAASERDAAAQVMTVLGTCLDQFVVEPAPCAGAVPARD